MVLFMNWSLPCWTLRSSSWPTSSGKTLSLIMSSMGTSRNRRTFLMQTALSHQVSHHSPELPVTSAKHTHTDPASPPRSWSWRSWVLIAFKLKVSGENGTHVYHVCPSVTIGEHSIKGVLNSLSPQYEPLASPALPPPHPQTPHTHIHVPLKAIEGKCYHKLSRVLMQLAPCGQ